MRRSQSSKRSRNRNRSRQVMDSCSSLFYYGNEQEAHDWNRMYRELESYHKQYGHANVPSSQENALSLWVTQQRHARIKNDLSVERMVRLKMLDFYFSDPMPSATSVRCNERSNQRSKKRSKERSKKRSKVCSNQRSKERSKERITKPKHSVKSGNNSGKDGKGASASREAQWMTLYTKLKAFYDAHGHCRLPPHQSYKPLSRWMEKQRQEGDGGGGSADGSAMPKDRRDLLNRVEFPWGEGLVRRKDQVWEVMFARLVQFKAKHNHIHVEGDERPQEQQQQQQPQQQPQQPQQPQKQFAPAEDLDRKLIVWCRKQQSLLRKNKLATHQRSRLVDLGFKRDVDLYEGDSESTTTSATTDATDVTDSTGATAITNTSTDTPNLSQAPRTNNNDQTNYNGQTMPDAHVDADTVWDWDSILIQLQGHKDEHGDCIVTTQSDEKLYKAIQMISTTHQKRKLSSYRIQQLNEIGLNLSSVTNSSTTTATCLNPKQSSDDKEEAGITIRKDSKGMQIIELIAETKDTEEQEWEVHIKELKEFFNTHQHFDVPYTLENGEPNSLSTWILSQKEKYAHGKIDLKLLGQLAELGFALKSDTKNDEIDGNVEDNNPEPFDLVVDNEKEKHKDDNCDGNRNVNNNPNPSANHPSTSSPWKWETNIKKILQLRKEKGRIIFSEEEDESLWKWSRSLYDKREKGTLPSNQNEELTSIGFWDSFSMEVDNPESSNGDIFKGVGKKQNDSNPSPTDTTTCRLSIKTRREEKGLKEMIPSSEMDVCNPFGGQFDKDEVSIESGSSIHQEQVRGLKDEQSKGTVETFSAGYSKGGNHCPGTSTMQPSNNADTSNNVKVEDASNKESSISFSLTGNSIDFENSQAKKGQDVQTGEPPSDLIIDEKDEKSLGNDSSFHKCPSTDRNSGRPYEISDHKLLSTPNDEDQVKPILASKNKGLGSLGNEVTIDVKNADSSIDTDKSKDIHSVEHRKDVSTDHSVSYCPSLDMRESDSILTTSLPCPTATLLKETTNSGKVNLTTHINTALEKVKPDGNLHKFVEKPLSAPTQRNEILTHHRNEQTQLKKNVGLADENWEKQKKSVITGIDDISTQPFCQKSLTKTLSVKVILKLNDENVLPPAYHLVKLRANIALQDKGSNKYLSYQPKAINSPSSRLVPKWTCDKCKVAVFDTFAAAEAHEKTCLVAGSSTTTKALKNGSAVEFDSKTSKKHISLTPEVSSNKHTSDGSLSSDDELCMKRSKRQRTPKSKKRKHLSGDVDSRNKSNILQKKKRKRRDELRSRTELHPRSDASKSRSIKSRSELHSRSDTLGSRPELHSRFAVIRPDHRLYFGTVIGNAQFRLRKMKYWDVVFDHNDKKGVMKEHRLKASIRFLQRIKCLYPILKLYEKSTKRRRPVCRIAKFFDGGVFNGVRFPAGVYFGTVTSFQLDSSGSEFWHITYDDGDKEVMGDKDAQQAVKLYQKHCKSDKHINTTEYSDEEECEFSDDENIKGFSSRKEQIK